MVKIAKNLKPPVLKTENLGRFSTVLKTAGKLTSSHCFSATDNVFNSEMFSLKMRSG